ncbi:MAG: hypothetical protein B6243_12330 [Anaerolineaceae bacterium 4572_5.2]|nr:MAG: hypothetical protein B6243_12330 [Anaerolineaceae bacterium 4572_5.2]
MQIFMISSENSFIPQFGIRLMGHRLTQIPQIFLCFINIICVLFEKLAHSLAYPELRFHETLRVLRDEFYKVPLISRVRLLSYPKKLRR